VAGTSKEGEDITAVRRKRQKGYSVYLRNNQGRQCFSGGALGQKENCAKGAGVIVLKRYTGTVQRLQEGGRNGSDGKRLNGF